MRQTFARSSAQAIAPGFALGTNANRDRAMNTGACTLPLSYSRPVCNGRFVAICCILALFIPSSSQPPPPPWCPCSYEQALEDASTALSLNPSAPDNYVLEAKYMHALNRLSEASSTLLQGLTGVAESDLAPNASYSHLLDSVRRERDYFHKSISLPSICFEKRGRRSTHTGKIGIFDPRKILDTDGYTIKKPDRPSLSLVERADTSIQLRWEEPYNGGDPIYKYVLQMASYEVRWDEKKKVIFDGFCDFVTVQEYKYRTREVTVSNLQPDNEYEFRLAAANCMGESEWSLELKVRNPARMFVQWKFAFLQGIARASLSADEHATQREGCGGAQRVAACELVTHGRGRAHCRAREAGAARAGVLGRHIVRWCLVGGADIGSCRDRIAYGRLLVHGSGMEELIDDIPGMLCKMLAKPPLKSLSSSTRRPISSECCMVVQLAKPDGMWRQQRNCE
eukprot:6214805-Pleurochrysis_carterae.AAC.2